MHDRHDKIPDMGRLVNPRAMLPHHADFVDVDVALPCGVFVLSLTAQLLS